MARIRPLSKAGAQLLGRHDEIHEEDVHTSGGADAHGADGTKESMPVVNPAKRNKSHNRYSVSIRGALPDDLVDRLSGLHAAALSFALHSPTVGVLGQLPGAPAGCTDSAAVIECPIVRSVGSTTDMNQST